MCDKNDKHYGNFEMDETYMSFNLFIFSHSLRHAKWKRIITFEERVAPNSWENHLRHSLHLLEPLLLSCNLSLKVMFTKRHHFSLGSHFQLMRWCIQICMWHLSLRTLHSTLYTRAFHLYFSVLNNAMIPFYEFHRLLHSSNTKQNLMNPNSGAFLCYAFGTYGDECYFSWVFSFWSLFIHLPIKLRMFHCQLRVWGCKMVPNLQ